MHIDEYCQETRLQPLVTFRKHSLFYKRLFVGITAGGSGYR